MNIKITLRGQVIVPHGSVAGLSVNLAQKFEGLQPADFET
jgi:hypothetical protein